MLTIAGHCRPAELQRHEHQQENRQTFTHIFSSVAAIDFPNAASTGAPLMFSGTSSDTPPTKIFKVHRVGQNPLREFLHRKIKRSAQVDAFNVGGCNTVHFQFFSKSGGNSTNNQQLSFTAIATHFQFFSRSGGNCLVNLDVALWSTQPASQWPPPHDGLSAGM